MEKIKSVSHPMFDTINMGTTITTSSLKEIKIKVDTSTLCVDYGNAVASELNRRNPQKFEVVQKQIEKDNFEEKDVAAVMSSYVQGLIGIRLDSINSKSVKCWHQAKRLGMPAIVQEAIACLGVFRDLEEGVVYKVDESIKYDISKLLKFSAYLEAFQSDGLKLYFDAFPRNEWGDDEVMNSMIIDGTIKTHSKLIHPASSYISVFLGLKCSDSKNNDRFLYEYDHIEFIKDLLVKELVRCTF